MHGEMTTARKKKKKKKREKRATKKAITHYLQIIQFSGKWG
jgi:hypothetical protein